MKFTGEAIIILVLSLALMACRADNNKKEVVKMHAAAETLEVTSNAIKPEEMIPQKYTCDGENVSPSLSWANVPSGTKELVLICDDPDAPMGTWVHWVVYGMPPNMTSLPENIAKTDTVSGFKQGKNSFGKVGYGGPCPPNGPAHRYFFKLYAIDKTMEIKPEATKDEIMKAIAGHVLAQGELMGRYGR